MKQLFLTSLFLGLFASITLAQNYQQAAGIRAGFPVSASYKQFLNESAAIEAYVGARFFTGYEWFTVSGAYQIHKPIESVEGLSYYFGGGASVYFWNFDNSFFLGETYSTTTFGIQGYLGLDYAFADAPINLTVDWIPTVFFNGFVSGFGGGYGAVGIRYILSR